METIELYIGKVIEEELNDDDVQRMVDVLKRLGCNHPESLARLWIALELMHPPSPSISSIELVAFLEMAISVANEHGLPSFKVISAAWIEKIHSSFPS